LGSLAWPVPYLPVCKLGAKFASCGFMDSMADPPIGASSTQPLLALRGITKQFPGCLANDHVDLTIGHNEIHALLGENGAGKSTLVKIIYGVMKPDAGTITWDGSNVTIPNPAQARALGVGMVFQHFSLFEALTVAENIALGINNAADRVGLNDRIVDISTRYGLPLDPARAVHDLSVGERQRIEIVRCLLQNPKLLIMDEPTSVLTPQEVFKLFETLRRLAAEGCSILYISHKLEEIRALCERATIMRLGKVVAHCTPAQKTARELAELMISATLKQQNFASRIAQDAKPRLILDRLTIRSNQQFGTDLKDISFSVAAGEILGIAGIAGNGQSELMDALSGEIPAGSPKNIILDGAQIGHEGPSARRKRGRRHVAGGKRLPLRQCPRRPQPPWPDRPQTHPRIRRRRDQTLRRPHHRPGGRSPGAVRRQSAKIPDRPRGRAKPQRADAQPAHLGGGCRRRRGDLRSSGRFGGIRHRHRHHLARPGRDSAPVRPHRRDRRRPRFAADAGKGSHHRADRPADGRRGHRLGGRACSGLNRAVSVRISGPMARRSSRSSSPSSPWASFSH
jgi:ABC-type multidrug transport system ATPase subunit